MFWFGFFQHAYRTVIIQAMLTMICSEKNVHSSKRKLSCKLPYIFLSKLSTFYVGHSKSNAFYLFPWNLQHIQRAQYHYLLEQILSYKTQFFNAVTIISCALPKMNKSLHAVLVKICSSGSDLLSLSPLLKHSIQHHTVLTSRLVSINVQQAPMTVSGCHFLFLHGGIQ